MRLMSNPLHSPWTANELGSMVRPPKMEENVRLLLADISFLKTSSSSSEVTNPLAGSEWTLK